jgi:SAM-dependent methyltransferase
MSYPMRPSWIQALCPAPKRYLQQLVLQLGLTNGLDIGCGGGSLLSSLRGSNFTSTGIDVSQASIDESRSKNVHDEYLLGDFRTMRFEKKYDVVVMSHVIEHFNRDEGADVLKRIEELALRLIYIETPYGYFEQQEYDNNYFQRHLSGWFPHDFEGRAYTVFGAGNGLMRSTTGRRLFQSKIGNLINKCTQRYFFRHPNHSATISAIKHIDELGNVHRV